MSASSSSGRQSACKNPTATELDAVQQVQLNQRALLGAAPSAGGAAFRLRRYPVGPELAPWLDFHWLIDWDLAAGQIHEQRVLPFPNAHLVLEAGQTALHGVARGLFLRRLQGRGRVHGLRFKCGGLRPWLSRPVQDLNGPPWPLHQALPWATPAQVQQLEARWLGQEADRAAIACVEEFLLPHRPQYRSQSPDLDLLVQQVMGDQSLVRVSQLQALLGMNERALQRYFADQLGVSPKWVIQRARLQDALQALAQADCPGLAELAATLGFCDQAHFSRCFRQVTGLTPAQYRRQRLSSAATGTSRD